MTDQIIIRHNRFPEIANKLPRETKALVAQTAFKVEAKEKLSMAVETKTGREYMRHGRVHTASAEGEAPAVDTGNLVNSIRVFFQNRGLTGIIRAAADYATFLEFGTLRMAARPFAIPAAESVRSWYQQRIEGLLRRL